MDQKLDLLKDYRASVERYFETGSSVIITNKDRSHAGILIATMFTMAKDRMVVFCQNLAADIYDTEEVQSAVMSAVERGVKVDILVQDSPQATRLVEALKPHVVNGRVRLFACIPGDTCSQAQVNFTVMDGKGFRLEANRAVFSAHACANNPQLAKGMLTLFDTLISTAQPLT